MTKYLLEPSLTYPKPGHRWFEFEAVEGCELADGYMVITQGVPGPRGGTSHIDVAGYFVQVHERDRDAGGPRHLLVMLLKEGPPDVNFVAGDLVTAETPDPVYGVTLTPNDEPRCTCTGYNTQRTCKHADAVYHLFFGVVAGEGEQCSASI